MRHVLTGGSRIFLQLSALLHHPTPEPRAHRKVAEKLNAVEIIVYYLRWDCAQTSVKSNRLQAQKIAPVLHIVWLTEQAALRLFSSLGMNGIVFGNSSSSRSSNGARKKKKKKCPGDPAESFCKCELEQMNIAFVLPSRRDGAQAVWGRGGRKY